MRVMLDGTEISSTVAMLPSGTFRAPPTRYAASVAGSLTALLSIFIERFTLAPSIEIWPSCAPTRRFRTSPATCAADNPASAALDGLTVISICRPALTRSLLTLARSVFAESFVTRRSEAASTSAARSPVMMTEMAFDPAAKPTSSMVTVQPAVPTSANSVARRVFASARLDSAVRRTVIRAAFGARPVVAATRVCVPVASALGIEVVTNTTERSFARISYAARLRVSTRSVEVPTGGFTVMVSTLSLPLLRNCVGMRLTSDVAPRKRLNAMSRVISFVARRRSASPRIGR